LPAQPYEFAEWKKVRVNIVGYHVEIDAHCYSVPYQLIRRTLQARLTAHTVECFHKGQRVARHPRSHPKGRHTTVPEYMPTSHRTYAEWTPQRLVLWAAKTGPATASVVQTILERRAHPQQGFRSCLGIMRLGKSFSEERLEAACRACAHPRRLQLQEHRAHPAPGTRPQSLARATGPGAVHHTREHPRFGLLPLRTNRRHPMLRHPTLEKLQTLRLSGMYKALTEQMRLPESDTLGFEERLGLLADREMTERQDRRLRSTKESRHGALRSDGHSR